MSTLGPYESSRIIYLPGRITVHRWLSKAVLYELLMTFLCTAYAVLTILNVNAPLGIGSYEYENSDRVRAKSQTSGNPNDDDRGDQLVCFGFQLYLCGDRARAARFDRSLRR